MIRDHELEKPMQAFHPALVAKALWELARYDLVTALAGFRGVRRGLSQLRCTQPARCRAMETAICQAMVWAMSLYCKPVKCLQRSVATARLLRKHRAYAQVVIGYRPVPFFSHAWVELDGEVVNDSPVYKQRLQILERV